MDDTPLVVVGIDASDAAAADTLDVAAREAHRRNARLEVIWAWGDRDAPSPAWEVRFDPYEVQLWAQATIEDLVARTPSLQDLPVLPWAVNDDATRALVEAGARAELLVVGARGGGGFLGLRLGSVSHKVLAHAPCPVLVVHGGDGPAGTDEDASDGGARVVVGVDGSEGAREAVRWAVGEAERRHAPLVVLHGWSPPAVAGATFPSAYPPAEAWEAGARLLVDAEVARARDQAPTLAVEGHTVCASGAGAMLDASSAAAVLVVGTRGRGRLAGALLGSTSQQVARHARCSVVVVPEGPGTDR